MISPNAVQCIFISSHFYLECFVQFTPCFCCCFCRCLCAPLIIAMAVTFISHILAFYWIWFTVWIYMRCHFMQKYSLISPLISNETILTRRMRTRVRDWLTDCVGICCWWWKLLLLSTHTVSVSVSQAHICVNAVSNIEIPWVHSSVTSRFVRCAHCVCVYVYIHVYMHVDSIFVSFFHFFYFFSFSPFD